MVTILTLPSGFTDGTPLGVSNDGSTIVGFMVPPLSTHNKAFIWTQANGVQDLQQVLTADGLGSQLSGWTLTQATAITPDGNTIVGNGTDREGQQEAWIVNLAPTPTLQSITVTPASLSIPIGAAQQFTATGLFSDKSTENITSQVAWASATPSVATISATGLARARGTGTSSITASLSGITGAAMLTVTPGPILQSITVTPANPSVAVGATQQFTAIGSFSDSSTENMTNEVTWASATPSVANISSAGLARALAIGTSSITASLGGITGSTVLTVSPPPILQSITVTPANPHITVGATEQFIATGSFSDNSTENLTSEVIWTSATPSVATISTTGLARAMATGDSSITASLSGASGAAILTVTATPLAGVYQTKTLLTATPRSSSVGRRITLTATVKNRSPAGGVPTGSVNFLDEFGNILGLQVRLRRGTATLRIRSLPVGRHTIQADYVGGAVLRTQRFGAAQRHHPGTPLKN